MKSTEFITEDINELSNALKQANLGDKYFTQVLGTVEQIKLHCQPFLNEIEDPFSLLRGLRPTHEWAVNKPVRLDGRKPMSTPLWLHNELNDVFKQEFGAPFRDSIFCTGDASQAKVYGMVFCVFPIGTYEYLWSPEVRDLYQRFDFFRGKGHNQKDFVNQLDLKLYKTNGLNDAIARGHEIMVRTKNYYGLNMNNIWTDKNSGPIQNAIQDYLIE